MRLFRDFFLSSLSSPYRLDFELDTLRLRRERETGNIPPTLFGFPVIVEESQCRRNWHR